MGCWYQVNAVIPLRKGVQEEARFKEWIDALRDDLGDDGSVEVTYADAVAINGQRIVGISGGGCMTISAPSRIDDLITRIGEEYAEHGTAVQYRYEDEDGAFFIGPAEEAKQRAKAEHYLGEAYDALGKAGMSSGVIELLMATARRSLGLEEDTAAV